MNSGIKESVWKELLRHASRDAKGQNLIADCPFCHKEQHFGLAFTKDHQPFNCFKCGEAGTSFKLLSHLQRLDLWTNDPIVDPNASVESAALVFKQTEVVIPLVEPGKMPRGLTPIEWHPYLEARGWTERDYAYCNACYTEDSFFDERVIFALEEDGIDVGYLSRSTQSKEWIDEENVFRKAEAQGEKYFKYLRWKNSKINFADYMFNGHRITKDTHTVILVEGLFGVQNITKLLNLYDQAGIVVCATFGKKISDIQIAKIQRFGVEHIILLYDTDAVDSTKKFSRELTQYFSVKIGFTGTNEDSGDLDATTLFALLDTLENPLNFSVNKVVLRTLI